jgi:hypothetical protein
MSYEKDEEMRKKGRATAILRGTTWSALDETMIAPV